MRRLKTTEIKKYRDQALQDQNNICPLCNEYISPEQAVLDHHHESGYIRKVLHRFCNLYLGKIENSQKRNKLTDEQVQNILNNAFDYMQDYTDILHSTYRTQEEKAALRKKRAKKRKNKINN